MPNLDVMAQEIHDMAVRKGWWAGSQDIRVNRLLEWILEEVAESADAYNARGTDAWTSVDAEGLEKPEGIASELADIWLLVMDIAQGLHIDMTAAVRQKLDYNHIRRYKRDEYDV